MAKFRHLLTPFSLKDLTLKNRVVMPPMCQYSATDGLPNDWHFVHYVSRAVGGVGLILIEMTNVAANGRISPYCLGLWNDKQRDAFKRIVDAVHEYDCKIGIQIAHAGRKAVGTDHPVSASGLRYEGADGLQGFDYQTPHELSTEEVGQLVTAYQESVQRAVQAGFDMIEIHGAHGYLIHQFHAPKSNQRSDAYGEDKFLFGCEVIKSAKAVMPEGMPLCVRISAQEYAKDGYDLDYGKQVAQRYSEAGADILHIGGGGDGDLHPDHAPVVGAGYQVPMARAIKQATGKPVIAVGMLDDASLADYVLGAGDADLVAIGRGLLRDPHWLLNAQYRQSASDAAPMQFVPKAYGRGFG